MEDLRDHDSAQFCHDAAHHIRGNRYKTKLNMTSVVLQTIHLHTYQAQQVRPRFQRKLNSEKQRSREMNPAGRTSLPESETQAQLSREQSA